MKGATQPNIVTSLKDGGTKSLAYVFNLFHKRLFAFACKLIGDDDPTAQDIVQDAFVKLWQKQSEMEGINNIEAYLFIVVRNQCFDYLKNHRKTVEVRKELSYLSETAVSDEDKMHAAVEAELIQMVFDLVERLPKQCRTVFEMVLYDNLSTAEISARLHITKRTVLNQKARAIKLLQIALLKRKLLIVCAYLVVKYFL